MDIPLRARTTNGEIGPVADQNYEYGIVQFLLYMKNQIKVQTVYTYQTVIVND